MKMKPAKKKNQRKVNIFGALRAPEQMAVQRTTCNGMLGLDSN